MSQPPIAVDASRNGAPHGSLPEQSARKVPPRARIKTGDSARAGDKESTASRGKRAKPGGLLTLYDVADRCTVSYWTARAWVDNGQLPALRLPGRLVRVRPADLEAFLGECAP